MSTYNTTKAGARRWFDDHLGATLSTVQTIDGATSWQPPNRVLSKRSAEQWLLGRSTVAITREHCVVDIDTDRLVVEWLDERGIVIHTTTYTVV